MQWARGVPPPTVAEHRVAAMACPVKGQAMSEREIEAVVREVTDAE